MENAIELLGDTPQLFVLPAAWHTEVGDSFRGIFCLYRREDTAMLWGIRALARWIQERVDVAVSALEQHRLVGAAIIVPVLWCRVLGAHYRGCVVAPTVGAGDWDRGNPPRVEAPLAYGATYVPITMGGLMTADQLTMLADADAPAPTDRLPGLPDSVIAAAKLLINAELDTTSPSRFQRAARVCEIIHQLAEMYFHRVADNEHEVARIFQGEHGFGNFRQAQIGVAANPPLVRQGELARDRNGRIVNEGGPRLPAANPYQQLLNAAATPAALADDLPRTPEERDFVRDVLSVENTLARALTLNNALQLRQHAEQFGLNVEDIDNAIRGEAHAVVHSVLLRGHPSHLDQPHDVQGPGGAGDGPRAGGPDGATQDGPQEEVGRLLVDGLRSGDGPEGAHRQDQQAHREGDEAGQAAGLGGEVRERQDGGDHGGAPQADPREVPEGIAAVLRVG